MIDLELDNVCCLLSFGALSDLKFHRLAFLKRFIPFALDRGVVYKHIFTFRRADKAIAFLITEPLYRSLNHVSSLGALRSFLDDFGSSGCRAKPKHPFPMKIPQKNRRAFCLAVKDDLVPRLLWFLKLL